MDVVHCSVCNGAITNHSVRRGPQGGSWHWEGTVPQIANFKGSVKALKDLPADAGTGDAYYAKDADALVVRQAGGWFHYDKET